MTVVVGIRHAGGVVLAADTVCTDYSGDQREMSGGKTTNLSDIVAVGSCGSVRVAQAIEYDVQIHGGPALGEDELRWTVRTLVPEIRRALGEGGTLIVNEEDAIEEQEADLLVAVRHRLFTIWGDFGVTEDVFPWATVGSGARVAAGHLHGLGWSADGLTTEKAAARAAEEAVKTAIKLNAYVDGRVTSSSTMRLTEDERRFVRKLAA